MTLKKFYLNSRAASIGRLFYCSLTKHKVAGSRFKTERLKLAQQSKTFTKGVRHRGKKAVAVSKVMSNVIVIPPLVQDIPVDASNKVSRRRLLVELKGRRALPFLAACCLLLALPMLLLL